MTMHPFIEAMLTQLRGRPAISAGSPDEARAMIAAGRNLLGEGTLMARTETIEISGEAGTIPGRLLVPRGGACGLVVYLHGGGWVVCSTADYEIFGRALAEASGCAVLLPEYRLAPEHPFPAALQDAESALMFAQREVSSLLGSPVAIVAAGDSAGANLATVAARRLAGKVDLALQVLIYPVTDCDFNSPSYVEHGAGLVLTAEDMRWFFENYAPSASWPSHDISPLRCADLSMLPPAIVSTAEYDVLASEGRAYAQRLSDCGIPVIQREVKGVTHGYIRLHNLLDVAAEEIRALGRDIRTACMNASA